MGLKLVLVDLARVVGIYSQKLNKDVGFRTIGFKSTTKSMGARNLYLVLELYGFKTSIS